jgi:hypothetical protein
MYTFCVRSMTTLWRVGEDHAHQRITVGVALDGTWGWP